MSRQRFPRAEASNPGTSSRLHTRFFTLALCACLLSLGACTSNSVLDLKTGNCFLSRGLSAEDTTVRELAIVDCAEDHNAEVFASKDLNAASQDDPDSTANTGNTDSTDKPAAPDFPGSTELRNLAQGYCTQAFEQFIGVSTMKSDLDMLEIFPTKESWEHTKDYTLLCVVMTPMLTQGSLKDSKR
ncbi:MAG: septum formation family protein [Actinomycetaceae bacterium]|nr:septum formation family protein [Actinomycetaceae bacterium]